MGGTLLLIFVPLGAGGLAVSTAAASEVYRFVGSSDSQMRNISQESTHVRRIGESEDVYRRN